MKIPASNVWKLDAAIPEEYAAILDPLGNAVHAVLAGPITGRTVLVTGCGPVGLMSIAVAKACGSSTIFATETNNHRRELARKMGADVVLRPAEGDAVGRVRSDTDGTGVDVLLEMSATLWRSSKDLRPYAREAGHETWLQATALVKAGRLEPDLLFDQRLPLERFEEAFEAIGRGAAGKILLYPNGTSR